MFFGTPSFGLQEKDWIECAAAMSNIGYASGSNSTPHISGDRYMSHLGFISDNFRRWLPDETFARKVICFYELSPIHDNVIVSYPTIVQNLFVLSCLFCLLDIF